MAKVNPIPPPLTIQDATRFWSHVAKADTDQCWLWQKGRDKDGYGHFKAQYRFLRAHKVAFFLHTNDWPDILILHRCDNPPCCNPAHLRVGTFLDNMRDKFEKGRFRRRGKDRKPKRQKRR